MNKVYISPSILGAKRDDLANEVKKISLTSSSFLHVDVMDGKFVKNTSFSFEELSLICQYSTLPIDMHIMIEKPEINYVSYLKYNPYFLTFHYEAISNKNDIKLLVKSLHKNNIRAGISIKPLTEIETIFPYLEEVDLVLLMSVEPGKGGQEFIPNSLSRAFKLKSQIKLLAPNRRPFLEIDGGINAKNSADCLNSGVDILVSGSYIFKEEPYEKQVLKLKNE